MWRRRRTAWLGRTPQVSRPTPGRNNSRESSWTDPGRGRPAVRARDRGSARGPPGAAGRGSARWPRPRPTTPVSFASPAFPTVTSTCGPSTRPSRAQATRRRAASVLSDLLSGRRRARPGDPHHRRGRRPDPAGRVEARDHAPRRGLWHHPVVRHAPAGLGRRHHAAARGRGITPPPQDATIRPRRHVHVQERGTRRLRSPRARRRRCEKPVALCGVPPPRRGPRRRARGHDAGARCPDRGQARHRLASPGPAVEGPWRSSGPGAVHRRQALRRSALRRRPGSGVFTIRGVMGGRHGITLEGLPDGWVLKSVTWRGRDITDDGIDAASRRTLPISA